MSQQYIVIIQSCWCNETGSGIHYGWDGGRFDTREEAIAEGFELRESDDFNIGVIDGEKLVSFDWMNEPIGDPPEVIAEISNLIGLEGADQ